jgi:hypothetical protein
LRGDLQFLEAARCSHGLNKTPSTSQPARLC